MKIMQSNVCELNEYFDIKEYQSDIGNIVLVVFWGKKEET